MKHLDTRLRSTGFTRTELLVTLTTLALLAAVTRPVWGNGGLSKSLLCMDNLRRLQAA
jgi:Tfp pilus assembly protein FimT